MRGLRSTLALFGVLVGLGAYIYFVTWEQDESPGSNLEKVFSSFDGDAVQELTIRAESGDTTRVRKEGDAWRIVEPVADRATSSEVSSITSALERLEVVRVIDENPADLGEYGLAEPRIEVEFSSAEGKPAGRLLIGAQTPTGGNLYAKLADQNRVFLIASYQEGSLNRSTFDLRDKTVLDFDRASVQSVEIRAGSRSIGLKKDGTEWRLTDPLTARADFGTVEGLVSRLETAQMQAVVTEEATPSDLKQYGLERPDATVTLGLGSARATLAIGGKSGDAAVYARDLSRPAVFTIDGALAEELRKASDDYRRRDAFEFRAYNATRAEFTRGGQTVAFERVKGSDANAPDSWRRVSPNPADVDRGKMDGLLAGLADIRAVSFTPSTANTGLDAPALVVAVTFEDGKKEERVTFGRRGSDVFFAAAPDPGAAKIEAEKFDEAITALDELSK